MSRFVHSDRSQQPAPTWQRPLSDTPSKGKPGAHVKAVAFIIWHKRGHEAEKSVILPCFWPLHLTLNYRQTFFQVQLRGEIIGTPSAAEILTHPSPPNATFSSNRRNWLQANNLSLQLAYHWAGVKAMAFCWITFPLINDTASDKISPGEWREDSVSIMTVCDGVNGWPKCISVSRFI